jgi:hypothetical protein
MKKITPFLLLFIVCSRSVIGQNEDLLKLVDSDTVQKEYAKNIFKSTRVINAQSIEMLGKGVMDVRILHRFGPISSGASNLFGLDQANMRFGFDYGISDRVSVGIGRSNVGKEFDGFLKLRPIWQATGPGGMPFSLIWVSGATLSTVPAPDDGSKPEFSSRMAYYHEALIGRKFNKRFSFQTGGVFVHRNIVGATAENNTWAIALGGRYKLSKRIAFVADYHHIIAGKQPGTYDPLSLGFDIETGGHVFQLHFSNAVGMNEKNFLTNTTDNFWKGEIRFGFNLSRVFTIKKH